MKRTFLATVLSIVFAMVAVACHSSDEKEKDHGKWEYEGLLSDGTKIDFNNKGEWKSVDCKYSTLPAGIIPDAIAADIAQRYPSQQPYKIEKETGGYEIDIPGFDLYYSSNGKFIRAEIDR